MQSLSTQVSVQKSDANLGHQTAGEGARATTRLLIGGRPARLLSRR